MENIIHNVTCQTSLVALMSLYFLVLAITKIISGDEYTTTFAHHNLSYFLWCPFLMAFLSFKLCLFVYVVRSGLC